MRHKKAATGAAAVLALGVGATAVAAPSGDGPLGGVFGPSPQERRAEQAQDLAKELNLPEDRVRRAIDRVGEKRRAEHQAEKAKELAKRLGVSDGAAAKALAEGHEALRKQFEGQRDRRQFRPRAGRDAFVKAVAEEVNKSTDEVTKALEDIRRDRLNAKLAEAVKEGRLTQEQADAIKRRAEQGGPMRGRFHGRGGPGFGPGGPGGPGGPPPGDEGRGQRRGGDFLMPPPPPDGGGRGAPSAPGCPRLATRLLRAAQRRPHGLLEWPHQRKGVVRS